MMLFMGANIDVPDYATEVSGGLGDSPSPKQLLPMGKTMLGLGLYLYTTDPAYAPDGRVFIFAGNETRKAGDHIALTRHSTPMKVTTRVLVRGDVGNKVPDH